MQLINIGFGNFISARDRGTLIDASCGKKTRSVIIMDSDHVVLSALSTESVYGRAAGKTEDDQDE